jgi:hypothetical protein
MYLLGALRNERIDTCSYTCLNDMGPVVVVANCAKDAVLLVLG